MSGFGFALCADDYALTPGVTDGILAALAARRLTATSVMTTRPHWRAAAPALRSFDGSVHVGLHFDLTLGPPLGRMRDLAGDGQLPTLPRLLALSLRRRVPQTEVRAELGRQLDAFEAEFGRPPDYLDGHQHVHLLPGIRDAVLDTCEARGLAGRVWLRDSTDHALRIRRRRTEARKALVVAAFGAGFAAAARARGFALNDGFAGYSAFRADDDYAAAFARYLRAPGPCHLVMCHPGYHDTDLARIDPATHSRDGELAFLLSDAFPARLAAAGAELCLPKVR